MNNIHHSVVIYPGVVLGKGITIEAGTVLGCPGAIRGCKDHQGILIIEDNVTIGANCVLNVGAKGETRIGKGTRVMNMTNIGHNVDIGQDCEIGAFSIVCGFAKLGDEVIVKSGVKIRNRVTITSGVIIAMGSLIVKDCLRRGLYMGSPARLSWKKGWIIKESK